MRGRGMFVYEPDGARAKYTLLVRRAVEVAGRPVVLVQVDRIQLPGNRRHAESGGKVLHSGLLAPVPPDT